MFRMISPRNDNLLVKTVDFTFSVAIILIVSVIVGFCNAEENSNTVHDSIFVKNYDFCSERLCFLVYTLKQMAWLDLSRIAGILFKAIIFLLFE